MTDQLTATALEIRRLFWVVTKLGQRDLTRRLEAQGIALGGLSFGVLRMLRRRGCTSSELSRAMMLAPATLVPAVDTLEREGYVRRGRDPRDRRRTPLALTERGAALVAAVPMVSKDDLLVRGLGTLSGVERTHLLRLLHKLVRHMVGDELPGGAVHALWQRIPARPRVAAARPVKVGARPIRRAHPVRRARPVKRR